MSFELNSTATGFSLSGEVRFDNVLNVRRDGRKLIQKSDLTSVEIDLSGMSSSDTCALSLLLRWIHFADEQGKQIRFVALPDSLLKVATVCGVAEIIDR